MMSSCSGVESSPRRFDIEAYVVSAMSLPYSQSRLILRRVVKTWVIKVDGKLLSADELIVQLYSAKERSKEQYTEAVT